MKSEVLHNDTILDIKEIKKDIPHRYPFILIDRVINIDLDKKTIVAIKCVTINEPFFSGHFPDFPIMPGVLILEALAQTGGILMQRKNSVKGSTPLLLHINHAKFRNPVVPGDVIYLHVHGAYLSAKGGKVEGKAMVEGNMVAEAKITFALKEI